MGLKVDDEVGIREVADEPLRTLDFDSISLAVATRTHYDSS